MRKVLTPFGGSHVITPVVATCDSPTSFILTCMESYCITQLSQSRQTSSGVRVVLLSNNINTVSHQFWRHATATRVSVFSACLHALSAAAAPSLERATLLIHNHTLNTCWSVKIYFKTVSPHELCIGCFSHN